MVDKDAIYRQMAANEELHNQGKLSYPALCAKNDALQAQLSAACSHRKTVIEKVGKDGYVKWCDEDDCGIELERKEDSGGAEAPAASSSSSSSSSDWGCVVVGVAMLSALAYGAVETLQALL